MWELLKQIFFNKSPKPNIKAQGAHFIPSVEASRARSRKTWKPAESKSRARETLASRISLNTSREFSRSHFLCVPLKVRREKIDFRSRTTRPKQRGRRKVSERKMFSFFIFVGDNEDRRNVHERFYEEFEKVNKSHNCSEQTLLHKCKK